MQNWFAIKTQRYFAKAMHALKAALAQSCSSFTVCYSQTEELCASCGCSPHGLWYIAPARPLSRRQISSPEVLRSHSACSKPRLIRRALSGTPQLPVAQANTQLGLYAGLYVQIVSMSCHITHFFMTSVGSCRHLPSDHAPPVHCPL